MREFQLLLDAVIILVDIIVIVLILKHWKGGK